MFLLPSNEKPKEYIHTLTIHFKHKKKKKGKEEEKANQHHSKINIHKWEEKKQCIKPSDFGVILTIPIYIQIILHSIQIFVPSLKTNGLKLFSRQNHCSFFIRPPSFFCSVS